APRRPRLALARRVPMTAPAVPPLISSDGHLEVRPERWSTWMPAKYGGHAPRTIKLPDGGDAILVEGQPPYPAPFLDLRAGRTNETWSPLGVTVAATAGGGPPEQRLQEQDMDLLHAEVLFPNMQVGPRLWRAIKDEDVYRATGRAYNDWLGGGYCRVSGGRAARAREQGRGRVPRHGARLQRLARRGVLRGVARPAHRPRRDSVDQRGGRRRRAPVLQAPRPQGRLPRRVPQRQGGPAAGGRSLRGRRRRYEAAVARARRLRPPRAPGVAAHLRVPRRLAGHPREDRAAQARRVGGAAVPRHGAVHELRPAHPRGRLRPVPGPEDLLRRDAPGLGAVLDGGGRLLVRAAPPLGRRAPHLQPAQR